MEEDDSAAENTAPGLDDLYQAIGAIAVATTRLEHSLASAVSTLTRSPLTSILVRGERASTLTRMCHRLLKDGIGSTSEDEKSGKTQRLGLVSFADTEEFFAILKRVDALVAQRDHVIHSVWLLTDSKDSFTGQKSTRSNAYDVREWNLSKLERLRQDLVNAQADVFVAGWNANSQISGLPRMAPRSGDVIG